eukprot:g8236.t1
MRQVHLAAEHARQHDALQQEAYIQAAEMVQQALESKEAEMARRKLGSDSGSSSDCSDAGSDLSGSGAERVAADAPDRCNSSAARLTLVRGTAAAAAALTTVACLLTALRAHARPGGRREAATPAAQAAGGGVRSPPAVMAGDGSAAAGSSASAGVVRARDVELSLEVEVLHEAGGKPARPVGTGRGEGDRGGTRDAADEQERRRCNIGAAHAVFAMDAAVEVWQVLE